MSVTTHLNHTDTNGPVDLLLPSPFFCLFFFLQKKHKHEKKKILIITFKQAHFGYKPFFTL